MAGANVNTHKKDVGLSPAIKKEIEYYLLCC